ncbi:MAG: glycosyl hydrolase [Verrucomicrobiota bacterium]
MKIPPSKHLLFASLLACSVYADSLESAFTQPPETTKPRCYWYWMDGQISKVGITRDLEAMKRVGIGEGYIGVISGQSGTPTSSTSKALTDEWWSFIEHAVREGTRLGVDVGLFNSPGWSQSGGPWVKPSQAMRYVTLPELRLHGPQHFVGKLPVPTGEYEDLAVLAFPVPAGEGEVAKITSRTPSLISFEMPSPFTARSVTVQPVKLVNVAAELLASDDGKQFRTVKKFAIDRHNLGVGVGPVPLAPVVASFPATTARFFQLKFSAACELGDIHVSPAARVESFAEKAMQKVCQDPHALYDFYTWPNVAEPNADGLTVKPDAVRDLSKLMAPDGTLNWEVPAGDWIVLRTALTPTGTKNSPAPPEATGFEVDKMNRVPLRSHFDAYVGNLLKRIPAADRKSWKHVVADSYETGPQNWTDGFAADFLKRYGYDPMPFLPVMTGRIVGSVDLSDRFLWDLRRLVADRIAKDYVGGLSDLCHEHGMKMWLENYGHWGFPAEFLQYGGLCDEIAGEFWASGDFENKQDTGYLGRYELRDASSAANIYNKPITWAEAFTGGPAFINSPRDLKARGDWAFCEGINQFVFHVNIHQPTDDKPPGINAGFGTEFNRNNTWFEQSKAWIDYLRRSTVLLQTGKHVADVAYFISEDAPKFAGPQQPPLPPGFDYDFINADVIEHRLAVKDGRLVLPDGMSFRLLALPESARMRPELLGKIRDLVKAGATVVGAPPSRSPSLENFPKCDAEVQSLAREIWGDANAKEPGEHLLGKGRVFWGKGLDTVFAELGLQPDFKTSAQLGFTHRHSDDAEIYFVANSKSESLTTTAAFRVGDKAPELWWPDSGRIERPAVYEAADGEVRLPMSFGPTGSVFVVFREKAAAPAERIVSVTRHGEEVLGTTVHSVPGASGGSESANNFTFAVWVKPDDDTSLVREANSGIVGMAEKRNEVFPPPHGNGFGGEAHAGCGLAVGRNGVGVFEHSGNYFAPTLIHAATLTNWTHLAVVYHDGQPTLYLNGVLAKTGLKSTHIVHSGATQDSTKFCGKLGRVVALARSLSADEIAQLAVSMPQPSTGDSEQPFQVTRDSAGNFSVQGGQPGDYQLKMADGQTRQLQVAATPAPIDITGPWDVSFAPGRGAPQKITFDVLTDWTKRPEEGIKHFSGKATYRRTFEVLAQRPPGSPMILDLGKVNDIATVRLNGRQLATLWLPPYRLDITDAVKLGSNTLEVDVVNTWNNRLVGDAALPLKQRITSITAATVSKDTPLTPAGLLGPVSLK